MKTFVRMIFAACSMLMLGSCIDFEQEIELNSDGSGEFEITVAVPDMGNDNEVDPFMSGEEAKTKAEASGVEVIENFTTKANGKVTSKLRVAFDDMDELNAFMKDGGEEGKEMNFKFTLETSGGESTLRHQIIPEKKESGEDADSAMGDMMMANMLRDSYYSIQWTLPSEVIDATDGATIEGNKVEFKVPMMALMNNSGVDVSATFKSATPKWIIFLIGGVVLIFVLVVLPRMLKKS